MAAGSTIAGHQDRLLYVPRSDLPGLEERIPALRRHGVSTVYLGDLTGTGPDVADPAVVAPPLDEASLQRLVTSIRAAGMDAIVDLELNHVASDSPLVDQYPDWFHAYGPIRDFEDVNQRQFFDIAGTRDFAQERPQVSAFLIGAASSFFDRAPVSGLGFKHVAHAPMAFWAELVWASGNSVDARLRTIGRYRTDEPKQLAFALRHGRFDEAFDRPFGRAAFETFCRGAPNERLAAVLSADYRYSKPESLITYVPDPESPEGCEERVLKAALTFQHGVRGRPLLLESAFTPGQENWLLRLHALRRDHPVFHSGESQLVAVGRAGILLLRQGRSEIAAVLYNAGEPRPLSVPLPMGVPASSVLKTLGMEIDSGRMTVPAVSTGIALFRRSGPLAWLDRDPRRVQIRVADAPPGATLSGAHPALGDGRAWSADRVIDVELRPGTALELALKSGTTTRRRYLFVDYQRGPAEFTVSWSGP